MNSLLLEGLNDWLRQQVRSLNEIAEIRHEVLVPKSSNLDHRIATNVGPKEIVSRSNLIG